MTQADKQWAHDKLCYYCNEPGVAKAHHVKCVTQRLIENGGHERAQELQREKVALENFLIDNELHEKWQDVKHIYLSRLGK